MRKIVGTVGAWLIVSPLLPFHLVVISGEKITNWCWPERILDKAEAVYEWGRRG